MPGVQAWACPSDLIIYVGNLIKIITGLTLLVVNGYVKARINGAGFDPLIAAGLAQLDLVCAHPCTLAFAHS